MKKNAGFNNKISFFLKGSGVTAQSIPPARIRPEVIWATTFYANGYKMGSARIYPFPYHATSIVTSNIYYQKILYLDMKFYYDHKKNIIMIIRNIKVPIPLPSLRKS